MVASTTAPELRPAELAPPALPQLTLRARAWAWLRTYGALAGLLLVATGLRAFRLGEVPGQLIGDEVWYVQDARVLLGLPVLLHNLPAKPESGLDPNSEHPPLAKLIIAGSMKLFGEREIAWRLPSVVLGTLSIWLLYGVVLKLGGTRRQALFAAFVLAFDNLSFIHGRIAMLDVYMTTFALLGTWLYLSAYFELAGLAFGVAALCKINGLFGLGAVLLYDALRLRRGAWRPTWAELQPRALAALLGVGFFLAGLGALDCYWTSFRGPFEHIAHMVRYHSGLKMAGGVPGNESTPLQWWLDSGTMDYFRWTVTESGVTKNILFRAALNEYLVLAAPVALVYAAGRTWAGDSRLGAFAVASFAANYGPVLAAWAIVSRKSYIFYMLPVVPAFACAIVLLAPRLPRSVQWGFAAAVLYAFFFSFPFRYF